MDVTAVRKKCFLTRLAVQWMSVNAKREPGIQPQDLRTAIVIAMIFISMHLSEWRVLPLHLTALLQMIHVAEEAKQQQLAGPGTTESGCSLALRSHTSISSH